MPSLSVLVITKNEAGRLSNCLESIKPLSNEIIVVDSGSTDGTREIAARYTDRVFYNRFESFPKQRNVALDKASGNWVLFIDADEVVTPELAAEIQRIMAAPIYEAGPVAYGLPRLNFMFGRWMQYAGWYPDYQYRFFRRDKGRYDEERMVHELAHFDGETAVLQAHLLHYNYDSLREFCGKQASYARMEAQSRAESGVKVKWRNFVLQPLREFRRRFIALEGRKEGALGFILSAMLAYYDLMVYVELKHLNRQAGKGSGT